MTITPHAAVGPAPATRQRITPNLFAISFGFAGLAQAWTGASRVAAAPAAVADGLWLVTGAVWLTTLALYVRSLASARRGR